MLTELRRARDRSPGSAAVRSRTSSDDWVDTTWNQLYDEAVSAAAQARRLPAGDPVVVVVDGTADSIATMLGVIGAGLDVLLLEEHSSYLNDPHSPVHALGASVVVGPATGEGHRSTPYQTYAEFRAPHDHYPDRTREGEVLQLTSGSTGVPRITRQPLANVLVGGRLYRQLFEMTGRDVVLVAVPVVHSYGLAGLCSALLAGATLVTIPEFSLRSLVAGLHDGATVLLGTPLLYRLLTPVLAVNGSPPRLRTALSAGGPMSAESAAETAAALGVRVRQIYGTTEAGLIACVPQSVTDWPEGSVGFAAPGVTLRLVGGDGDAGRMFVRTPMMFRGYWGSTLQSLTDEGFYDTGDLVRVDSDGHVFVVGRKDGVVNVGGRKVSPQRVEHILLDHPGVRDASVYGVERPDREQEMHAAVVLTPATSAADVLEFCRSRALQPYEVPHRIHVLDHLPRTGMGKVDRQAVLAATGHLPVTLPSTQAEE